MAGRPILTLKAELIWLRDWESADELRRAVEAWRIFYNYNTERPHQAPDWATPAERRMARRANRAKAA